MNDIWVGPKNKHKILIVSEFFKYNKKLMKKKLNCLQKFDYLKPEESIKQDDIHLKLKSTTCTCNWHLLYCDRNLSSWCCIHTDFLLISTCTSNKFEIKYSNEHDQSLIKKIINSIFCNTGTCSTFLVYL